MNNLADILTQHKLWLGDSSKGEKANLRGADLRGADLRGADLREADLRGADLRGTDLRGTDLREADLSGTDLSEAHLREADLSGADLRGTDLREADLRGANLIKTILDPANNFDPPTEQQIIKSGMILNGGWVYGWRTKQSQHVGNQVYEIGKIYVAPVFSTDTETECHPGIYLSGQEMLDKTYRNVPRVRCRSKLQNVLQARNKFRCRRLEILPNDFVIPE